MDPLVSIIIPTYNRAHLIGETLDSVLAQTYKNWECIVVDDGSTDYTDELLEFYTKRDSRIKYHHRPTDRKKGANACRNYGFELSKGEYVNWFDSDDLMLEDFLLKKTIAFKNSKRALDIIFCESETFKIEKGKRVKIREFKILVDNFYENYVLRKFFLSIPSGLIKVEFLKRTFLKNKLYDENLTQSQDYDFYFRLLQYSPEFIVLHSPLFKYRKGTSSISSDFYVENSKHINSYLSVRNKILDTHGDDSTIYKGILNQVSAALRSKLNIEDYGLAQIYLDFLKKNSFLKSPIYTFLYLRFFIVYKFCKFLGRGTYFFKNYLKY